MPMVKRVKVGVLLEVLHSVQSLLNVLPMKMVRLQQRLLKMVIIGTLNWMENVRHWVTISCRTSWQSSSMKKECLFGNSIICVSHKCVVRKMK